MNTQYAFLDKRKVPTKEALQQSIDSLGFKLQLHPEFTPFEDEGFSPCVLEGQDDDVGFEIYYEPASEVIEDDEEWTALATDRDYCISMCWGGSMNDCACVLIVSCALMKDFDAVISYEGYEPESFDALLKSAKAAIKDGRQA